MSTPSIYSSIGALSVLANLYPDCEFYVLRIPEISDQILDQIRTYLKDRLVSETIYSGGMPDILATQKMQEAFWRNANPSNSVLLGIGGGSVMDIAKVMRFQPAGIGWLRENLDVEINVNQDCKIPLVLAPTTAGTGSEVTPTATIWDFKSQQKHSFFGPQVMADIAIVDPYLCLGAPWNISRDSAIDALSHALEAIWNTNATPETTELAISAANDICHNLSNLKDNLNNIQIRAQLSKASLSAGLAMAKTQTALAHALSYSETASSQMSHGKACAYWLPFVWQLFIQSQGSDTQKSEVNRALQNHFPSPSELYDWLIDLGFEVHPPYRRDLDSDARVKQVRLSARGKNFAGFTTND